MPNWMLGYQKLGFVACQNFPHAIHSYGVPQPDNLLDDIQSGKICKPLRTTVDEVDKSCVE